MAIADLVFRVFADTKELKSGVSAAKKELDNLAESASGVGRNLLSALPPSMGTEAKKIGGAVGALAGSFGGLGAVVAGVGITALANDFLNTTGKLSDLSAQTDISIQDLQRLQYVGDLVGVSLDEIASAVGQLQRRLGSGDEGATKAIRQLGLSLEDVKKMEGADLFITIGKAIGNIRDPLQRASVATDAFGRAGISMLPVFRSNLEEVVKQALLLSDGVVQAGDNAGDMITKFTALSRAFLGNIVFGPIVSWVENVQEAVRDVGNSIDAIRGKIDTMPVIPTSGFGGKGGPANITMSMKEADQVVEELNRKIATQLVKSQEELAKKAREAAVAYRELTTAAGELVERGIDRQIAAERELFGNSVSSGLVASLRLTREELIVTLPVMSDWAAANATTTQTLTDMVAAGLTLPAVTAEQAHAFVTVKDTTVEWDKSLTKLAQSLTNLATTSKNSFVGALSTIVNAIDVSSKSVKSLKGGFDEMTSGSGLKSILAGFTGIVGGIGGLVSAAQAAISIGRTLFGLFDRDKGRDLVENFVKQFGGFEGIQKIFAGMGDEGHRLWVMLTQGVGRNNPDEARRAIAEVEKAFDALGSAIGGGVGAAIDSLRGKEIHIPIKFDVEEPNIPAMAAGGIVNRPTIALIGEAGPEAVVPLGQMGSMGGSDKATLAELQGVRADLKRLPDVLFRSIRDAYQTA